MGVCAVEQLLANNSNIVVCANNDEIGVMDISYALTLDRYYKGKASDEELSCFSEAEIIKMKEHCEKRLAYRAKLYDVINKINI
jgi:hypothetical protein